MASGPEEMNDWLLEQNLGREEHSRAFHVI